MERKIDTPKKKIQKAKDMLKDYPGAKLRIRLYPRKRPTFMKQMKIDLTEYEETGEVKYDTDLAAKLDKEDSSFLNQYLADLENIWLIDFVLSGKDETTRKIICDLYEGNKTTEEVAAKYGIPERTIQRRTLKVISELASLLV